MPYGIRCQKCGHEFEVAKWHPGMECPKCKATDTAPVTRVSSGPARPPQMQAMRDAGERVEWKKSPVVGAIAVIIIVASWVGILWWAYGPEPKYEIWIHAMCRGCGQTFEAVSDELPETCPQCGAAGQVYQAYVCNGKDEKGKKIECGNVFPFVPPEPLEPLDYEKMEGMSEAQRTKMEEDYRKKEEAYYKKEEEARKCPKCGSYNTELQYTEEQKKKFEEIRRKYAKKP